MLPRPRPRVPASSPALAPTEPLGILRYRHKLLSAKLAALRREMSVGIQAAAALSDKFSKVSTDGDFIGQIHWSTYLRDFILLYIYILFHRVNVLEHLPQRMRAGAAGGHARRDATHSEFIE